VSKYQDELRAAIESLLAEPESQRLIEAVRIKFNDAYNDVKQDMEQLAMEVEGKLKYYENVPLMKAMNSNKLLEREALWRELDELYQSDGIFDEFHNKKTKINKLRRKLGLGE
jgi:hypothetical protein